MVPFTAGGTTDLIARIMAQWLTDRLGQPVVVENRPGGGTNIAVQAVVNAPPDGYTLLFTVSTNTINPSLYKSLPFDFQRDIAPVAGLAELPLVLMVNPARAGEDRRRVRRAGQGQSGQDQRRLVRRPHRQPSDDRADQGTTGIDVVHVPYPGGARDDGRPASPAASRPAVDALPNSLPHIRSGAVRALAILPPARIPTLPDVPTIGETIPGFEVSTWSGVGVPRGTPAEIIERLNREINAGLDDERVKARFAEVGATPLRWTSAEFAARIGRDTETWARVVKLAGIAPE